MLGDIKRRLLVTRVQGALAVADVAAEQGDGRRALGLYRDQARDLAGRGLDAELEVRAWLGVLRAAEVMLAARQPVADAAREACAGLARVQREELPGPWARYDAFRGLIVLLLEAEPARAQELAALLRRWFPADPRPHYAWARAGDALLAQLADPRERAAAARRVADGYTAALHAADAVGSRARWEPILVTRAAAALWRWAGYDDPEAATRARALLDGLSREAVAQAEPAYQLAVAQIWLGGERAMLRLRALDLLEALLERGGDGMRAAVLRTVDVWLEGQGWSYYKTEHDRVRAIVARAAPALGPSATRRIRSYLDLLAILHDAEGRRAAPSRAHLERLRDYAAESPEATIAPALYALTLTLADAPAERWRDALTAALPHHRYALDAAARRLHDEPLAIALLALRQLVAPDMIEARALLRALADPDHQVPHAQDTFALLLPTLLHHWHAWPELIPSAAEATRRFIRYARRPAPGFAALGLAMLALHEPDLGALAARRALTDPTAEPPELLQDLLAALARRALLQGDPREAARWLVASPTPP